mgnify:FL=1
MRSINITGKNNIDKINEIEKSTYKSVRLHMDNLNDSLLNHKFQNEMIRKMYLSDSIHNLLNDDFKIAQSLITRELNNKIQGYKGQDLKKNTHNANTIITMDNLLEKLVGSMLICYYCKKQIMVLYKNVREQSQWTLDRIDNSLSHTNNNTCISCLKCNLQRKVMNSDKFKFTKNLKINKI